MALKSNVLLYIGPSRQNGKRVRELVEEVARSGVITVVRDLLHLARFLQQPLNQIDAAVVMTSSETELRNALRLRDLLLRLPMILILPDRDAETIAIGHALRPRFITDLESDLGDMRDVLQKILSRGGVQNAKIDSAPANADCIFRPDESLERAPLPAMAASARL